MTRKTRRFLAAALASMAAFTCLPGYAQTITLTTENYPPFNMQDDATGRIVGISTDLVRAIMSRAGHGYELAFLPWQRAFNDALRKVEKTVADKYSGMTSGLGLPAGLKLPF